MIVSQLIHHLKRFGSGTPQSPYLNPKYQNGLEVAFPENFFDSWNGH